MRMIVDTHVFLWSLTKPKRIDAARRRRLESMANIVYVSSVSVAEIMIKTSIGKLDVDFDPVETIVRAGFEPLDFKIEDAKLLKTMPLHHKDPFDRMLIAQSLANKFPIMTDDVKFNLYDCEVV